MRLTRWLAWVGIMAVGTHTAAAHAAPAPATGPAPSWVTPAPPGATTVAAAGNSTPLFDEQMLVEGDRLTAYIDTAMPVTTPETLNKLGTISIPWSPSHGDLTFHRIDILRGSQIIDALHAGQGFTVLRREAGLERLVVDGQLTAVKHIEGLRVGDVLRVSFSISESDKVLAGNIQNGLMLIPAPARIGFGRARLVWPANRPLQLRGLMPGLDLKPSPLADGRNEVVIHLPTAKLPEMPDGTPERFKPLPVVQLSSFASWSEVAAVMAPLYATAGTIAPGSDLARVVDAIAARSADPLVRMAAALRAVQDDVRYQLVALGTGNYVPQSPAETWAKRYGDCKAKTLLLLAMLNRLGITAEGVMAHGSQGDAVRARLPSAMAFNHVFVRAETGGQVYWLDGTMLGSRQADMADVPPYGTVLPLHPGADLVDLPRRANARPEIDVRLTVDMSAGPSLPSPYALTVRYSGPHGIASMVEKGADYEERLRVFAEKVAKKWTGSDSIGVPQAEYDAEQAVWTLKLDGVNVTTWDFDADQFRLGLKPELTVVLNAPRDKSIWRLIPAQIDRPWTAHSTVEYRLPAQAKVSGPMSGKISIPAADWQRTVTTPAGAVVQDITSRENGTEIAPEAISPTVKAINDKMSEVVHIDLDKTYPRRAQVALTARNGPQMSRTRAIFDERIAAKPDDASRVADRAWLAEKLLDWEAAETDYSRAITLDASAQRYLDRAYVRSDRGNHPDALKDAQAAYDLEQGNENVRQMLALELAEAGRVEEALDLSDSNPDMMTDDGIKHLLQRIDVLETGDRHAQAIALLDAALLKRQNSPELHNARCWYNGLRNTDLKNALADCNRAIELAASPAAYIDSRAMVQFRMGKLKEARTDFEAALATSPDQPSSLFMAGIVEARLSGGAAGREDIADARLLLPKITHYFERYGIRAPN